MCKLKRKAIIVPKTKNGAKGISLFILCFLERRTRAMPKTAPIQKAKTIPDKASDVPRSHPKPRASLASPKPIQVPEETSHIKAKGKATMGPERNCIKLGIWRTKPYSLNKNIPTKDNTPKIKENISGIILCRKSYTDITIKIEKAKA